MLLTLGDVMGVFLQSCAYFTRHLLYLYLWHVVLLVPKKSYFPHSTKQSCHVACLRGEPCPLEQGTAAPEHIVTWDGHRPSRPDRVSPCSLQAWAALPPPVEPSLALRCSSVWKDACSGLLLYLCKPCSSVTPGIMSQWHTRKLWAWNLWRPHDKHDLREI